MVWRTSLRAEAVQSSPFKINAPAGLLSVTVSIGLAERGADANPDALMRRADKALYDSKAAGRNRVTLAAA
ncbi:MAG: diguanylate cyclase [Methylocystis sp.]